MEKTIFLFQRHRDRSKTDFARYYIERHAPLGARLTRCLLGYTVNIVEGDTGPDAVTEHWLRSATDLLTPDIAYASRDDFEAVVADDRTLFSGSTLYVVVEETYPVPGETIAVPTGQPTPETKSIWFYRRAADAPPPPAGAHRVIDNSVGYALSFDGDGRRVRSAPDYELIRMAWAADIEALGPAAEDALIVGEYPFVPAPRWDRGHPDPHRSTPGRRERQLPSVHSISSTTSPSKP